MSEELRFVADTYAFIELHKGNPEYTQLAKNDWVTTEIALIELYYNILRSFNAATAYRFYTLNKKRAIGLTDATIVKAMQFKFENKKDKLSYTDCLGYALAMELGIPFLTGDRKFKGKKNVTWVA